VHRVSLTFFAHIDVDTLRRLADLRREKGELALKRIQVSQIVREALH